jgi:hypothetical protein
MVLAGWDWEWLCLWSDSVEENVTRVSTTHGSTHGTDQSVSVRGTLYGSDQSREHAWYRVWCRWDEYVSTQAQFS